MKKRKYFFLNGEQYYTTSRLTLLNIIKYFHYSTSFFVVEYNNLICNKNNWDKIYLENNDKIEIVTIVGGG
jgi:thiamine biosynthesis protein ThiS